MTEPTPQSLLIIDLLSFQGTPDLGLFDLVKEILEEAIVPPENLYVFADLSSLYSGLCDPLPSDASAAEKIIHVLGPREDNQGPGSYNRGGKPGLLYLRHLFSDPKNTATLAPLLNFAFGKSPTAAQCRVSFPIESISNLLLELENFVTGTVAPRVQGHRCSAVIFSHGGITPITNEDYRFGDWAIQGMPSVVDKRYWINENLPTKWWSESVLTPLATAVGNMGYLLWFQSTCYAPPIIRCLAESLYHPSPTHPLCTFPPVSRTTSESVHEPVPPAQCTSTTPPPSPPYLSAPPKIILAADMPLFSPLQDFVSTFGMYNMSHRFKAPLLELSAALRDAADWVKIRDGISRFPRAMLEALASFDVAYGAELVSHERLRAAWAGEVWWGRDEDDDGKKKKARSLPPPPTCPPNRERAWKTQASLTAHAEFVWKRESESIEKEGCPPAIQELYAKALGHLKPQLEEEPVSPRGALSESLFRASQALGDSWRETYGLTQHLGQLPSYGAAAPPILHRVLQRAIMLSLQSSVKYVRPSMSPWHKQTFCLSTLTRCMDRAIASELLGKKNGGGEEGGGEEGGTPQGHQPPPTPTLLYVDEWASGIGTAPWEMSSLEHSRIFSACFLPLLHSIPPDALLVARLKCLNDASLRLASARIAVLESFHGVEENLPYPSLLHAWSSRGILPDPPASDGDTGREVPSHYLLAVLKAAIEVSAARWPGALRLLGEVVGSVSSKPAPGGGLHDELGYGGSQSGAAAADTADGGSTSAAFLHFSQNLNELLEKAGSGEMQSKLNPLPLLRKIKTGECKTVYQLEAELCSHYQKTRTHISAQRPLLEEDTLVALSRCSRVGGVYAFGVGGDSEL